MSNCGPTCGPLCRSDTLVKWLAHYGNVPVCWAGPHYGTARPLATHIREDEDGFTPACEAHRRLTVLKEHPMTNEDQLRVIRERLAAITPRHITANPMQWQQDGNYLLQLVTEQQREIDRLGNYHEALIELKEHIEEIAVADKDEWKASGLEAVATMLRMWHIEGVQEMKQELRALKNPRKQESQI